MAANTFACLNDVSEGDSISKKKKNSIRRKKSLKKKASIPALKEDLKKDDGDHGSLNGLASASSRTASPSQGYSSDDLLGSSDSSSESGDNDAYDSFDDFIRDKDRDSVSHDSPTQSRRRARSDPNGFGNGAKKTRLLSPSPQTKSRQKLGGTTPTFKAAPKFGRKSIFIVFVWESLFYWRGVRQKLKKLMNWASTYEEWKEAAMNLDSYLDHDGWKNETESDLFNFHLIQKTTRRLKRYRLANQPVEVQKLLTHACKRNHGGCANESLYSQTYFGTKDTIDRYWNEVEKSLTYLADTPLLNLAEKKDFFKNAARNYGRTALCLSGGAGFAFYHLGVLRALFEEGILPEVITGTSAGSLMAALVCTRTDEEIIEDGIFEKDVIRYGNVMSEPWIVRIKRWWKTGALFDSEEGFRIMGTATKGHMTFMEAYKKTGRILCITVVPDEQGSISPPKVLNFLTAPDVLISSAIVASSAVPGVLLPSRLLCKTPSGELVSWHGSGKRWRDGSIRTDIPDLPWLNIGFTIVSQVNPHIAVFFYESQGSAGCPTAHRSGRGWRGGFLASTIVHHLDLDLKKWLRLTKDLKLLPLIASTDVSSLWLQQFEGSATILPASDHRLLDWMQILDDPDPARMQLCLDRGRMRTWPKIQYISNRMRVENAIKRIRMDLFAQESNQFGMSSQATSSAHSSPALLSRAPLSMDEDDSEHELFSRKTDLRKKKGLSFPG
ncbi:hypothetical protein HDU97_009507 [Phlyctochytrium planicorne]|nr:hypothetical protein HDU97_009507 [Phlyctochytrium planicorne]